MNNVLPSFRKLCAASVLLSPKYSEDIIYTCSLLTELPLVPGTSSCSGDVSIHVCALVIALLT